MTSNNFQWNQVPTQSKCEILSAASIWGYKTSFTVKIGKLGSLKILAPYLQCTRRQIPEDTNFLWLFLDRCGTSQSTKCYCQDFGRKRSWLTQDRTAIPKLAHRSEGSRKEHHSEYWVSPGDMRNVHLLKTPEHQPTSSTLCSVHRLNDGQDLLKPYNSDCQPVFCVQSCSSLKVCKGAGIFHEIPSASKSWITRVDSA